jgi:pimeloyl-ACP methyl ester carboxylesterase
MEAGVRTMKLLSLLVVMAWVAACASTQTMQPPAAQAPEAGAQKPGAASAAGGSAAAASARQSGNTTSNAPTEKAAPKALFATSGDGTKIAYEVTGSGPALLLVHGGGQTRASWKQQGYVDRLSKRFTVISMDLRGAGDSDKPMRPEAYALDRWVADLLAVADAAKAPRFHAWGFGHGATIVRYLAAQSDRVLSTVLVGTTMGPAVTGVFKNALVGMRTKWQPVVDAHVAGKLDPAALSPSDRAAWEGGMAVTVMSLTAFLEFPPLEPNAIKVPTLWAVGADDSAMENVKEYEGKLAGTNVTLKVLSSVNYSDSFVKMEQVMAEVEPFLTKASGSP